MANVVFLVACIVQVHMYNTGTEQVLVYKYVRMNSPLGNKSFFELRGDEMRQLVMEDGYCVFFLCK